MKNTKIPPNIIESLVLVIAIAYMIATVYKHLTGMIDQNTFTLNLILGVAAAIYAYVSVMYRQLVKIEYALKPKDQWGDADFIEGVFTKEVCEDLKTNKKR